MKMPVIPRTPPPQRRPRSQATPPEGTAIDQDLWLNCCFVEQILISAASVAHPSPGQPTLAWRSYLKPQGFILLSFALMPS